MKELDFELLNSYAKCLNGNSRFYEIEDIVSDIDNFNVYKYGDKKDEWRGLPVASFRDKDGKLTVAETKVLSHAIAIGATGSGKSQGLLFNAVFNMNKNTSYIILDVKREILPRTYDHVSKIVGENNIKILNFANPKNATDKFNYFCMLAERFVAVSNDKSLKAYEKEEKQDEIFTDLHKFIVNIFPIRTQQDASWDIGAREMVVGLIAGLIEDCVLERQVGLRKPLIPQQVSFERVVKIFKKMKWNRNENGFDDGGFFVTRKENSYATTCAQTVLGASSAGTRSSYLSLVNSYLEPYFLNKTASVCNGHTLDVVSFGEKPQVLYLVFDITSDIQRTLVNSTLVSIIDILLEKTHNEGQALKIPMVCLLDEFPVLGFSQEYLNIASVGRGSNIYEVLICQSLAQLKSVYKEKAEIFLDNTDVRYFLGSNDIETAKKFSYEFGTHKAINESAVLQGNIIFESVPLVSPDILLHDMKMGECYATLFRHQPLHSKFELYFKTNEYNKAPLIDITQFQFKELSCGNYCETQNVIDEKTKIENAKKNLELRREEILRRIQGVVQGEKNDESESKTKPIENQDKSFDIENGVLIKYNGKRKYVSIPDIVNKIGDKSFENNNHIIKVKLSERITEIGEFAFSGCETLTEIIFSKGLEKICDYAFHETSGLSKAVLPDTISEIGICAFYHSDIETLKTGGRIKIIKEKTFFESALNKIEISRSVKEIERQAFGNCSYLAEVTFIGGRKKIDPAAFDKCESIQRIKFIGTKKELESIKKSLYYGTKGLETVVLPNEILSLKNNERRLVGFPSLNVDKVKIIFQEI